MPYEFRLERMVEFAETDMAGIMHFSNYFRFMEATEHAFFRALGMSVHDHPAAGMRGWARVRAACNYAEPLQYEDLVEVHLLVREKKAKSISYDFTFRKLGEPGGVVADRPVARGAVTVVHVERPGGERTIRAVTMPPEVDAAIEVAPAGLLEPKDERHGE